MTDQTEAAEVEALVDLVRIVCEHGRISALGMAELVDYVAARVAAARAEGAERVLAAVEATEPYEEIDDRYDRGFNAGRRQAIFAARAAATGGGS